jgi:hypothetical protein
MSHGEWTGFLPTGTRREQPCVSIDWFRTQVAIELAAFRAHKSISYRAL